MVQLECPLCCKGNFDSPSSLKCHLLETLELIQCPICNEKFGTLFELVAHLDSNCGEISDDDPLGSDKEEGDDKNTIVEESILAKALLEGHKEPRVKNEEEDTLYYCETCDVHLNNINSHLSKFHKGQEIVLEAEIAVPNGDQSLASEPTPPSIDPEPVTEDIQDKDGRLYTRKFVKIDKFWLEKETEEEEEVVEEEPKAKVIEVSLCQICKVYYPVTEAHTCPEQRKNDFSCDVCNTPFPSFKSLRLHQRMHEPIKSREVEAPANYEEGEEPKRQMFTCQICYKEYYKEYEQMHLASHDCSNGHNCDVCNRKFFTKSNLEMHMKAHSNNKKFTCSYCKKLFVTYDSLNEHLSNQCQKRPYACQYCGRRFTRPHEKVKHERIHTGEKPHVCDVCGKAFRVSYCLTLHLRTHSGTRPYQCGHCGKRFKSHSVYNHHLLTHSDVRAYKCPYCPKAFKTSVQLAGHKNSHIKPFTCTECNRPFASLYAVRAHMETHKRDNNLKYECWMCGALYSRAFALRDHLKQQHQQTEVEKAKANDVGVDEEMEAANSVLVNEEDIILGLEGATSIEIIENGGE